jgi:hypothetical protein
MQSSVSMNPSAARAGMVAYPLRDSKIDTYAAEGNVKFGYAVVKGTGSNQCKLVATAGDTFLGIATLTQFRSHDSATSDPHYPDDDAVNVMSFGEIWAPYNGTAPTVGATLYVDVAAATGKLTATSASNLAAPLKCKAVDTSLGLVLAAFTQAV